MALGSGRAVMVEAGMNKDEDDFKLKVAQIIKLPQRNSTTAGKKKIFIFTEKLQILNKLYYIIITKQELGCQLKQLPVTK